MTDEEKALKAKQYGSYEDFVINMTVIMNRLRMHRGLEANIDEDDVDNFFLVLKLMRAQTVEDDPDSYYDLSNYSELIRKRRFGNK